MMTDQEKLAAIQSIVLGNAPDAPPSVPWTRNPGAPVVPGVTCYDDVAESKRYASQGYTSSGIPAALAPLTLAVALDLADKLLAANRAGRENLVRGAGALDPDTAAVAVLTGYLNGGGLGGEFYLTLGAASLASLIRKPGTVGHPSGFGA